MMNFPLPPCIFPPFLYQCVVGRSGFFHPPEISLTYKVLRLLPLEILKSGFQVSYIIQVVTVSSCYSGTIKESFEGNKELREKFK
jgi:hypothetical protein